MKATVAEEEKVLELQLAKEKDALSELDQALATKQKEEGAVKAELQKVLESISGETG